MVGLGAGGAVRSELVLGGHRAERVGVWGVYEVMAAGRAHACEERQGQVCDPSSSLRQARPGAARRERRSSSTTNSSTNSSSGSAPCPARCAACSSACPPPSAVHAAVAGGRREVEGCVLL